MEEQLANLQEIPLPEPVAYTPQTIGWYLLLVLLILVTVALVASWRRRINRNRYRRQALQELEHIASSERPLSDLPVLVKRVVLAFARRETVAGLTGQAWLEFLDSTYPGAHFTSGPGKLLPDISYASARTLESWSDHQRREVIDLVGRWIRGHNAGI